MKLIIGLGNPGKEFANNRHNAGFIILDQLQQLLGLPEFKVEKKFEAEISEATKDGEKIILAKPQTFMNLSGKSVRAIMTFYKIPIEDITLIHDDLDIELGKYKLSEDASAAGHNGVQSVFDTLGTQKIKRLRIGIEGTEKKKDRLMSGSDFVLKDFSEDELQTIKNLAKEITRMV